MGTEAIPAHPSYPVIRQWQRYKLDVPVRVLLLSQGRVKIIEGRGNELNGGGMAVFAGTELSVGMFIAVEFTPPYSGSPIRVRCIVRNRNGYTYGVEFLMENDDDHQSVHQIRAVLAGLGSPR